MSTPAARRRSGFTLLETMVATLVVAIGLLSLSGAQLFSLRSTHQGLLRSQATAIANDMAERLRANRGGVAGGHFSALPVADGTFCNHPPASCIGGGVCDAGELAAFDYHDSACHGAAALLPGGRLALDCDLSGSDPICAISVGWSEPLPTADPSGPPPPPAIVGSVAMRVQP